MRVLVLTLATLTLAPQAHAGVRSDVAALRQKVQKGYSASALKQFDRGVRIGTPTSGGVEHDLSGPGFSRKMLDDGHGRSLTYDLNSAQGSEASYAGRITRSGETSVLRQPGASIVGKQLVLSDTATRMTPGGVTTEGVLYRERSLLGKLLRIESTTRYHADVDSQQRSTMRIRSDKRRLVIAGIRVPLPASGKQAIDRMYGK